MKYKVQNLLGGKMLNYFIFLKIMCLALLIVSSNSCNLLLPEINNEITVFSAWRAFPGSPTQAPTLLTNSNFGPLLGGDIFSDPECKHSISIGEIVTYSKHVIG